MALDASGLEIRIVNVAVNEHHIDDVVANVAFTLHLTETNGRVLCRCRWMQTSENGTEGNANNIIILHE